MNEQKTKLDKIRVFVDKMPSLSTTVSKVLEICSRTDTSPNDLNKVISLDPVLTGQVLKLINSAYYSLVNKGVGQAKKTKALPIKDFWAHSIAVGVMAKLLAVERGLPPAEREEYFVAGLLHDLGKIPFGDEYIDVLARANREQQSLVQLEKLCLEIDHEEIGEMIASKWKLNAVITDAICHHHAPELADPAHQALVATIALADFYVCLFDIGYAGNRYPDAAQLDGLLDLCGLQWADVVGLSAAVDDEIKKAEIFLQV